MFSLLCGLWQWFLQKEESRRVPLLGTTITTSLKSTAQGGGGSFKNRKSIGEVACCEPRMAERSHCWIERWLELCFLEWLQWLQCSVVECSEGAVVLECSVV